ncbi:MAG: ABC transporter substrate-binding protein [Thermoplasmatales archaeon]
MKLRIKVLLTFFVAFLMLTGVLLQSVDAQRMTTNNQPAANSSNSTFIVGWGGPNIDTLNPYTTVNAWPHYILSEVYSTLCFLAPNQTALLPDLAESWQIYDSNGTAIFHLNPNAKWSNGDPVTSQDVNYSYYLAGQSFSSISPDVSMITSISTPNTDTVIFHFHGTLFTYMAVPNVFVVPYNIWSKIANVGAYFGYNSTSTFVGSGPFVISNYQANDYITLTKNPVQWLPSLTPHVGTVIMEYFPTLTSMVSALQTGQIDAIGPSIEPAQESLIASDKSVITVESTPDMYYYLGFNTNPNGNGPKSLQNVTVRQAIAYSINDTALSKLIWGNMGMTVGTVFPPDSPFYDPSLAPYPYDPTLAEQMLNDAGYTIGSNGVRDNPNGTEMVFTIDTLSNYPDQIDAASIISNDLEAIGIKCTVQAMDVGTLIDTIWPDYNYSLDLWDWPVAPASPYPLSVFLSWQTQAGVDDSGYYNVSYDHLYERMMNATSITNATQIAYELETSLHWNLPYYPLYTRIPFQAYSDRWTGVNTSFSGGPFGSYDWITLSTVHLVNTTTTHSVTTTNYSLVIGIIIAVVVVIAAVVFANFIAINKRKTKINK